MRQLSAAQWQNAENHDDITALDFHPNGSGYILAGGDDGQVSIFDSGIAEEQDSLIQGFSHGPIHKAGYLDQNSIYALSSDQDLALHPAFNDSRAEEPVPIQLGDLRPKIPCEYVIDVVRTGPESVIAAGSHRYVGRLFS
jgi:WD repeat-containing protein 89